MDLSHLSDKELEAIANGGQAAQGDLSHLSDAELENIAGIGGKVVQEMHPDLGTGERFAVQAFGGDLPTAVKYLQGHHPDMQFQVRDNQVIAKRPEETDWRTLAPHGFAGGSPAEIGRSLLDALPGLASGAISGLAAGAAGAAAAPETLGAGSIPAAIAAGAGTSAALETARQGIGKMLGVTPEFSGTDIALSGALGGLAPGLLGTSGTQSLVGQGVKALAPKALGALSGVAPETIQAAAQDVAPNLKAYLPKGGSTYLDLAEHMTQQPESTLLRDTAKDVTGKIKGGKEALKGAYEQTLNEINPTVDISKSRGVFDDKIAALRKIGNDAGNSAADQLEAMRDSIFKGVEDQVPATKARAIADQIEELADFKNPGKAGEASATAKNTAKDAWHKVTGQIYDSLDKASPSGDAGTTLRQAYKNQSDVARELLKKFATGQSAESTLAKFGGTNKSVLTDALKNLDQNYGTNVQDVIKAMQVKNAFGAPQWLPKSGAATSTTRTLTGHGLGALLGGALGYEAGGGKGAALGGAAGGLAGGAATSPAVIKKLIQGYLKTKPAGDLVREISKGVGQSGAVPALWQLLGEQPK